MEKFSQAKDSKVNPTVLPRMEARWKHAAGAGATNGLKEKEQSEDNRDRPPSVRPLQYRITTIAK
jgi:hypothetical protein